MRGLLPKSLVETGVDEDFEEVCLFEEVSALGDALEVCRSSAREAASSPPSSPPAFLLE